MTHTVSYVDPDSLPAIFPMVEEYLLGALKYTPEYTLEDVISEVLEGDSQLFVIDKDGEVVGTAVTVLERHPRRSYVQVHLVGGKDAKEWAGLLREKMKLLAKELGYDGVSIYARRGWQKIYPDLKYEKVIMVDLIGESDVGETS